MFIGLLIILSGVIALAAGLILLHTTNQRTRHQRARH